MEEESLWGTILSEENAFWQGVASHEVCAGARKLRRAAEVFADPKVENEVSDDKGGKAKVESNSKKQHRAA